MVFRSPWFTWLSAKYDLAFSITRIGIVFHFQLIIMGIIKSRTIRWVEQMA